MAVTVNYYDKTNEIQFRCPNDRCEVRTKILENLKNAGVDARDNGGDLYVSADKFSSTADLEQKVFSGFTVVADYKSHEHYDHTGTEMKIGYGSVTPGAKEGAQLTLFKEFEKSLDDAKKAEIDAPNVNSKDLLDQHYGAKPSAQM